MRIISFIIVTILIIFTDLSATNIHLQQEQYDAKKILNNSDIDYLISSCKHNDSSFFDLALVDTSVLKLIKVDFLKQYIYYYHNKKDKIEFSNDSKWYFNSIFQDKNKLCCSLINVTLDKDESNKYYINFVTYYLMAIDKTSNKICLLKKLSYVYHSMIGSINSTVAQKGLNKFIVNIDQEWAEEKVTTKKTSLLINLQKDYTLHIDTLMNTTIIK